MEESAKSKGKEPKDTAMQTVGDSGLPLVADEKTANPLYFSSRELPLRFLIPVLKVKPFFDGLREGKVLATKCRKCGMKYFPPRGDCSNCRGADMEYFPLSTDAVLTAFTLIEVKPYSFSRYDNYAVAVGRLPEGLNVVAWLTGCEFGDMKVGMKLKLRVAKREVDGVYAYSFVPA